MWMKGKHSIVSPFRDELNLNSFCVAYGYSILASGPLNL